MKKLIIALSLFFVMPTCILAGSGDTWMHWDLNNDIIAHQIRGGEDHTTSLAMMDAGGSIAYCIEPGVIGDNDAWYSSTSNVNDLTIKNVDVKTLSLIGFYGYGYLGHNTDRYYMATQELIWRNRGVGDVFWTSGSKTGPRINIENEKNEIKRLVNNHYVTPEFDNKNYLIGDEVRIKDLKGVLKDYKLSSDSVFKDGNYIEFKVKEKNFFSVEKSKDKRVTRYYYRRPFQTIASFGLMDEIKKDYEIKGVYGSITVDKYDLNTNSKYSNINMSLSKAKYGIYKDGILLDEKQTDENGTLVFEGLEKGTYVIKETEACKGYEIDEKEYNVSLDSNNINALVKSYDKEIESTIKITKYFNNKEKGLYEKEKDIVFLVYDEKGNLYDKYKTDEEGSITFVLPYGKYVIKQETKLPGVKKVDDFLVVVDGSKKMLVYNLINEPEKLPNTGKSVFDFLPLLLGFLYVKKFV